MKVNQEDIVTRQMVLNIELEDADLDTYLDRGYKRVVQRASIPGFRKGKAPRRIVESLLGRDSLLNEVLDSMLPELTSQAISNEEIDAGGLPRIELLTLSPVTFKATIPLKPEVDLGEYRDIRMDEDSAEVTEEDVEERLQKLQSSMASWNPVERAVNMGDMVTMEAVGTVDGQMVLNEKDAVYVLDPDSSRPFPGFSQRLEGLALDEVKEFTLDIPDDFPDTIIAGKEAEFSATLKEIKERILPELDNEFAKSVGDDHETLEALRDDIERELKDETEKRVKDQYNESVVQTLIAGATVELAPLMVEHEIDHMEENRQMVLQRINIRLDDYLQSVGKTQEELRSEMEAEAIERLKRTFVLSKVGELEKMEATPKEIEERAKSLLTDYGEGANTDQIPEDVRASVERMLIAEKTINLLATIARGEGETSTTTVENVLEAEEIKDDEIEKSLEREGERSDDAEA